MREPIRQLLQLLETTFEPAQSKPESWIGSFVIATADYVATVLLPTLVDTTKRATPGLSIRIANITRDCAAELRAETIDMIIAPPQIIDGGTLMSRRLFSDRFVVLYSLHRPPSNHSIEEYLKHSHVATVVDAAHRSDHQPRSHFSEELDDLRSAQRNVAVLPYYSLLPLHICGTEHLALVQERLAQRFAKILPVAYMEPPIAIPPLDLHMFWSPRFNEDERHVWMRNTLFEACAAFR